MTDDQLRYIGKAISALRFTANTWEWINEQAKTEMLTISDRLIEIETEEYNRRINKSVSQLCEFTERRNGTGDE